MCATRFMQCVLLVVLFVSWTSALDAQKAEFQLAPIASATTESSTFTLVADKQCDAAVVKTIYELYARNTMVFQTCVVEGKYKIFPFSGTHPTSKQIGDMAKSLACRAIFTSLCLAGIPQCKMSNFPMRSAAETLLKIGVDIDLYPTSESAIPSTERFLQMMHWRRDVNLAEGAGLPCDSQSKLYAEYSSNLYTVTTNGLVRLTADKVVQYRSTIDGSFSQDQIMSVPSFPGLRGSGSSGKFTAVYATEATVKPPRNSSTDGVVTHAQVKSKAKQSSITEAPKLEKTSTSDAKATSAAVKVAWAWPHVAAVIAVVAMYAFA